MQKIFSRIHAIPQLSSLGSPGIDPLSPPAFPMSKCRYWLHPQEGHPELLPPPHMGHKPGMGRAQKQGDHSSELLAQRQQDAAGGWIGKSPIKIKSQGID